MVSAFCIFYSKEWNKRKIEWKEKRINPNQKFDLNIYKIIMKKNK